MSLSTVTTEVEGLLTPSSDDSTVVDDLDNNTLATAEQQDTTKPLLETNQVVGANPPPLPDSIPPQHAQKSIALPPHIIILYNDRTDSPTAWGRIGVANLGYHEFGRLVFDAFVLHPARAPRWTFSLFEKSDHSIFWETYNYLKADFFSKARFVPQFAVRSNYQGGLYEDLISLQSVGWREMIHNVVSIRVEYKMPEDYPGKRDLHRILTRSLRG
ncbi:hypothetical protein C8Q77DRAFT_238583 [Trametes polyzona]|nr:hypothetical protein C8Q77DRAFT_238583 [Trametes polyzona]